MSFWNFTRSPSGARLLVEFGGERGIAPIDLLKRTGLQLAQLDDPNLELSAEQELRVAANLLRLTGAPEQLGIEAGLRYHFSAFGIWGYGLVSSACVGNALKLALRFIPLTYAFTRISFHEEGPLAVLCFGEPDLDLKLTRFLVERDMGIAAALLRELIGPDFKMARLAFTSRASRKAPEPSERGERWHLPDAAPQWSAKVNSLAFDRAYLMRPLPQANAATAAMCAQMCTELMERKRVRAGTAGVVRQYLGVPGSPPPDLEAMAELMNVSARTVKRRLKEEGTSFRTLLMESRRVQAEELLSDPALTMAEIAGRLGFSDSSTFSQAFKRWYAVAPSTWRKRLAT